MNQTNEQPRISFKQLPARARKLEGSELSVVFGGCVPEGQGCKIPSDCCDHKHSCGTNGPWSRNSNSAICYKIYEYWQSRD
jgi:hypothetical protein